ncbi:MAG: hypothetical protein ABSG82_08590 [Sedimentisphaerales bacterium]|jgi:hypothetical protein
MPTGESEFNYVFWTTFQLLGNLSSFYSNMLRGLPRGVHLAMEQFEETWDDLYEDGTLATFLNDPSKVDDFYSDCEEKIEEVHEKQKKDTKNTLDAVAIVYAHGILDECAYKYLEILSLASPESFSNCIEKKQIPLIELKSKTYDQLYREKIAEYLENVVEKNSLMFKLDKIHEITKPTNTKMNRDINYERRKFDEFNTARHNIVHGNDWRSYSIDFSKESLYWGLLNFYLAKLVSQKTGLKLSNEELSKVPLI